MKKATKDVLLAIFLGIIIPTAVIRVTETWLIPKEDSPPQTETTQAPTRQLTEEQSICVLTEQNTYRNMALEEYVLGVVHAEMPASFEPEALKAQAVVARTYALKRSTTAGKHLQNAVCTDPNCCQAYKDPSFEEEELLQKVRDAVVSTAGKVLTYDGALIEATYFSCSGGRTEDAQAVWGQQIPYLISVSSPGEEQATHYTDTVQFELDEFCTLLELEKPDNTQNWLSNVEYTDGGGVEAIKIGGKVYTGMQLRQLLGLRSTAFVISVVGQTVTVTTKGFGHRVGMSQYGAEAMAVNGDTYETILSHYYPGTVLEHWRGD